MDCDTWEKFTIQNFNRMEAELAALKALVCEMYDFVLLYAAITPNPILEGQARKILARDDVKAILKEGE